MTKVTPGLGPGPNKLLQLTETEKSILAKHSGCFWCRHFYASHHAAECKVPPHLRNHSPVTETNTLKACDWAHEMGALHFPNPRARVAAAVQLDNDHPQLPPHA